MSYKVQFKKAQGGGFSATFQGIVAHLDAKAVRASGLGPALKKIAHQLALQNKYRHGRGEEMKEIIGVTFECLEFNFVLDTVPAPEVKVAKVLMGEKTS